MTPDFFLHPNFDTDLRDVKRNAQPARVKVQCLGTLLCDRRGHNFLTTVLFKI